MSTNRRPASQVVRIHAERPRKPVAPRTCCPEHTDTCRFGSKHLWTSPWVDEHGTWHGTDKCFGCQGVCSAELRAAHDQPTTTDKEA